MSSAVGSNGINVSDRAKYTLSTGDEIWDFSGNIDEAVDFGTSSTLSAVPVGAGNLDTDAFSPFRFESPLYNSGFYNYAQNFDDVYGTGGSFMSNSGPYTLKKLGGRGHADYTNGFRCVHRPP